MEIKEKISSSLNGNAELKTIQFSKNIPIEVNEINEIISSRPPFIVRWGTVFFFGLLLVVAMIAWVIEYPDIIVTTGILNSINAPKEVIAKTDGKLVKLFISENQQVKAGNVLGYLESTANHEEILELSRHLNHVAVLMQDNATDELTQYLSLSFNSLGELQSSFQEYMQSFREFSDYLTTGFYLRKKKMLNEDIGYSRKMHEVLLQQKNILLQDLALFDSSFKANEVLKNEKVISSFDYRLEKSKLLSKEMSLPQITSSIINNENLQHEKQKEIAELENRIQQQKGIFIQALNTFKSYIEEWKRKYFLTAPVEGNISFATFLQENQQLKAGQLICFINTGNTNYYVETRIPQYNFGKVKVGQPVILKFEAYPFQEFGTVKGKIIAINTVPSDSGYLAKIEMPTGLITNFKKQIQYRTGLSVRSEIVTENKRLLQRLFESIVKKVNR